MHAHTLERALSTLHGSWGSPRTPLVTLARLQLETLVRAPRSEAWLASVLATDASDVELYRDPEHGFVLLSHLEEPGTFRPPHDHGEGWVVYAVLSGEVEMGTFGRVTDEAGRVRLVERDRAVLRPGDCRVYLPGDVHDSRARTTARLLRLTSCDLREEASTGRLTRFSRVGDAWTSEAA